MTGTIQDFSKIRYRRNGWNFSLPTIRTYNFDRETLDSFFSAEMPYPLVLDINIENGCNANCIYCYTKHGTTNRFYQGGRLKNLTDEQNIEVIRQLKELGGKAVFICSDGEPLLSPQRFVKIVEESIDQGFGILTYTNIINLNKGLARRLHELGVNLVMKRESLDPYKNSNIIRPNIQYRYGTLEGQLVPEQMIDTLDEYSSNRDMLAISTMACSRNYGEILDIREWSNNGLGCAHFLKLLYKFGYAEENWDILELSTDEQQALTEAVYRYDSRQEVIYPGESLPDEYSYDVRRFLNNSVNRRGFPLRVFGHPRMGVYHNSGIVRPDFGFDTDHICMMVDGEGRIDMGKYFSDIGRIIEEHTRND